MALQINLLEKLQAWFYTEDEIDTKLDTKVDKVTGKGLSTEDYTTAEKTKLAGIEAEANKTIVDSTLSDSSTNPVQNNVVKSALDGKAAASHTQGTDTILLANNDTLTNKLASIDSDLTDIKNNKMSMAIVSELPATGNVNTVYAVPNENESGDNVFTEYWWNSSKSEFEEMGDRTIDLSGYVQKSDVSLSLSNEGVLSITC